MKLNHSTARTVSANYKKDETIEKTPKGGSVRYLLTQGRVNEIESLVTYSPEITLKEIKEKMEVDEPNFTTSSVHRCLHELQITLKLASREL